MPKYKSFEWNGYSISTKPIGWRRLFHYPANLWEFPYSAGDYIKLGITIRKHQTDLRPARLRVFEFLPVHSLEDAIYHEKEVYKSTIENIELGKPVNIQIISKDSITVTGDGYYTADISIEELPEPDKPLPQIVSIENFNQNIVTFHARQSETVAIAAYGFVWTLFVFLITFFVGR